MDHNTVLKKHLIYMYLLAVTEEHLHITDLACRSGSCQTNIWQIVTTLPSMAYLHFLMQHLDQLIPFIFVSKGLAQGRKSDVSGLSNVSALSSMRHSTGCATISKVMLLSLAHTCTVLCG